MRQLFLARTHVARLNTPHIRICIPFGLVDRCVKPTVGAQAVLVDDTVHIFQNFWLCGDRLIPVRFRVCGQRVEVNWDVGAASGISIVPPRSSNVSATFKNLCNNILFYSLWRPDAC